MKIRGSKLKGYGISKVAVPRFYYLAIMQLVLVSVYIAIFSRFKTFACLCFIFVQLMYPYKSLNRKATKQVMTEM